MKKILVPCDFSGPAIEAFKFAVELTGKSGGTITVVKVIDLPIMTYGASMDMPVYTYDPQLFKELKESAQQNYNKMVEKYSKGFSKLKFLVLEGPTFATLRGLIGGKKFDLVVMGTHGSSGLQEFFVGSNTEKVVRFSTVPVMAVRKSLPVSSIKNIVYPTSLQSGQSDFIKRLKEVQKFFNAKLHILFLNTPFNFIRDNELKDFARKHQFTNYTLNIRSDRYEPDGIISFADEVKADMLAMPTHARKGLSHLIYGSITEDVVNHVQCPVWTCAIKN